MQSTDAGRGERRVVAVDALRGLVILVLVPDLFGGFAFYKMAELHPDSSLWGWLGRQFRHVPWSGAALWDFVMPVFIFLVGVSITLSYRNRIARGASYRQLLVHAVVRSFALILLGLLIYYKPLTEVDLILPYLVLSLGLPVAAWGSRLLGIDKPEKQLALQHTWSVLVLGFVSVWLVLHYPQLREYTLSQILVQIGLAYLPAFLLVRTSSGTKLGVAAGILTLYGLAFVLYTPPPELKPTGEVFTGWFAHWNNGNNLAAAFDYWLLNRLPRATPYAGEFLGHHTLPFIPLISVMLVGMLVGESLLRVNDPKALARRFAMVAIVGIATGWLMSLRLFPLVKLLSTPSWIIFSTGVALLTLATLYWVLDARGHQRWALPLTVLGANSVLLYMLAAIERWRVVGFWQKLIDADWLAAQPFVESVLVLVFFWLLAFVLHRARFFVRI